jgi:hypothetical protein
METIFVASSFHDYDRDLVNDVSSVIEALSLRPQAGRNMGGEPLEDSIKQRIESCDGLVALFTKRQAADNWQTHPWVVGEFGHALSMKIPAIAVVEDGIDWNVTPWAGRQRITLHRDRSAEAVLDLVRQIGAWQREAGITLQVLLSNPEVLQRYMEMPDGLEISYRYIQRARAGDFVKCKTIYLDANAIVVVLQGIPGPECSVELKIEVGPKLWRSTVRQLVQADLTEVR